MISFVPPQNITRSGWFHRYVVRDSSTLGTVSPRSSASHGTVGSSGTLYCSGTLGTSGTVATSVVPCEGVVFSVRHSWWSSDWRKPGQQDVGDRLLIRVN